MNAVAVYIVFVCIVVCWIWWGYIVHMTRHFVRSQNPCNPTIILKFGI